LAEGIDRVGADGQMAVGMPSVSGGWRICRMVRRQETTTSRAVRRLEDGTPVPVARFDFFTRRAAENHEGPRRRNHLGTVCPL
jgi:hypothetical protein